MGALTPQDGGESRIDKKNIPFCIFREICENIYFYIYL